MENRLGGLIAKMAEWKRPIVQKEKQPVPTVKHVSADELSHIQKQVRCLELVFK